MNLEKKLSMLLSSLFHDKISKEKYVISFLRPLRKKIIKQSGDEICLQGNICRNEIEGLNITHTIDIIRNKRK